MSLLEEPMHPGEVLKELYLDPLDLRAIAFARRLDEEVKLRLDEQMAEAEEIYKDARDAVVSCRPLNAQWEQDVHAFASRYFDFMHSRARWFMLPHEAAAAMRAGEDLSWMSYYQAGGSRSGRYRS